MKGRATEKKDEHQNIMACSLYVLCTAPHLLHVVLALPIV